MRVHTNFIIEYLILELKVAIIMLVPNNNPPGYKECVIYFITFDFGKVFTIIYWLSNMNIYVPDIV